MERGVCVCVFRNDRNFVDSWLCLVASCCRAVFRCAPIRIRVHTKTTERRSIDRWIPRRTSETLAERSHALPHGCGLCRVAVAAARCFSTARCAASFRSRVSFPSRVPFRYALAAGSVSAQSPTTATSYPNRTSSSRTLGSKSTVRPMFVESCRTSATRPVGDPATRIRWEGRTDARRIPLSPLPRRRPSTDERISSALPPSPLASTTSRTV
mmetsp:Transcript_17658/g.36313  ORF Transcript_17658/g.36313 Transcript_17658/m.36313 type:complete len:212 (+) Transcript_17658:1114-1749(+)